MFVCFSSLSLSLYDMGRHAVTTRSAWVGLDSFTTLYISITFESGGRSNCRSLLRIDLLR